MTAAATLMAKERGDVTFAAHLLFYPVTDANFDTGSYEQHRRRRRRLPRGTPRWRLFGLARPSCGRWAVRG
jgi:acetyl esterase/lipase